MKLSEVHGMQIYSDRAHFIGTIDDTIIDDKEGMVVGLVFGRKEGKAISIPYSGLMAIGDIVLVYSKKAEQAGV